MAYTRVNWKDAPGSKSTPLNAANLNQMDEGIANNASDIATLNTKTGDLESDVTELNSNLTANDGLNFRFATDGEGNYGYLGADDSFIPFKSGGSQVGVALIPQMTSKTTPSGYVITQSSEYSSSYASWYAFDKSVATAWVSAENAYTNAWLQVEFPKARKIGACKVTNRGGTVVNAPKSVIVLGSNDGNTYEEIGSYVNTNNTANNVWYFLCDNTKTYKYVRFKINSKNGSSSFVDIGELQFYDGDYKEYLYKDGKQNVAWDNTGYQGKTPWDSIGATLETSRIYASVPSVSKDTCSSIVTENVIDLSEYKTLKIVYDGTNEKSLSVETIKSSAYITVGLLRLTSGEKYLRVTASPTKELWDEATVRYAELNLTMSNTYIGINRVWLEK